MAVAEDAEATARPSVFWVSDVGSVVLLSAELGTGWDRPGKVLGRVFHL